MGLYFHISCTYPISSVGSTFRVPGPRCTWKKATTLRIEGLRYCANRLKLLPAPRWVFSICRKRDRYHKFRRICTLMRCILRVFVQTLSQPHAKRDLYFSRWWGISRKERIMNVRIEFIGAVSSERKHCMYVRITRQSAAALCRLLCPADIRQLMIDHATELPTARKLSLYLPRICRWDEANYYSHTMLVSQQCLTIASDVSIFIRGLRNNWPYRNKVDHESPENRQARLPLT